MSTFLYNIDIFVTYLTGILSLILLIFIYKRKKKPYHRRVFFSYSHKDAEIAKKLTTYLESKKINLYVDFGIVIPDEHLGNILKYEVSQSKIFILLASDNSLGSVWVDLEYNNSDKRIHFFQQPNKNIIIIGLDQSGVELYGKLKLYYDVLYNNYIEEMKYSDIEYQNLINYFNKNNRFKALSLKLALKIKDLIFGEDLVSDASAATQLIPTLKFFDFTSSFNKAEDLKKYIYNITITSTEKTKFFKIYKVILLIFLIMIFLENWFCIIIGEPFFHFSFNLIRKLHQS